MRVNKNEVIAKRLKETRQKLNLTQAYIAEKLFITRQTYSNYEKGKLCITISELARLCEQDLFDCDLGYLIGDYDEKKYDTHFISEYTGLSEDAIMSLNILKQDENPLLKGGLSKRFLTYINLFLTSNFFFNLLHNMDGYIYADDPNEQDICLFKIIRNFTRILEKYMDSIRRAVKK